MIDIETARRSSTELFLLETITAGLLFHRFLLPRVPGFIGVVVVPTLILFVRVVVSPVIFFVGMGMSGLSNRLNLALRPFVLTPRVMVVL
jgi:hypothetical protein